MNYAFSLGCKKDEAREKTHQGPLADPREKTFLVPGRIDPIAQRHAGNDFSSDRNAKGTQKCSSQQSRTGYPLLH